jgi:hypothetical protein
MSMTRRLPLAGGAQRTTGSRPAGSRPAWWPAWSKPAALRALRAVLVIPSLFALTYEGFGNLQMALFAAFGGFANLVVASFGGSRRDKAIAHFGLALIGSVGIIIGTAVNGIDWLAVLLTIPVTFGIFFAGVAGPNAASGVIAALFPYVLSVVTAGTVSMLPDRLAGWWLASAVSAVAVLALSPPSPGDRLRMAAAGSARALADALDLAAGGTATTADHKACQAAKQELMSAFASTPYRPTGLATTDQAMASVVQYLEWCTALVADATDGHPNLDRAARPDRDLLAETAVVLRQAGGLLALRGFLAEQGAKHLSKSDLWMLVMATMRLRLTAYSLAGLQAPAHARQHPHRGMAYAKNVLTQATAELAAFYERVAVLVGRPMAHEVLLPVTVPAFTGLDGTTAVDRASPEEVSAVVEVGAALGAAGPGGDSEAYGDTALVRIITIRHHPHLLWVHEHLQHLSSHAQAITGPATHVAEQRRQPWWR